ncbi:MAG: glycosyltransferase family 4 protein [Alphaproteobacteria bacterium]
MQPRKNLRTLISAFARMTRARDLPHELVLAGGHGWLTGDLTAYAGSKRVADRLRYLGSVPQDDLPALYSSATALVYPSWYEGFGLPPLEAMACGLPVVASTAASIREVVGDAGLLVDPNDIEGLARAMARVIDEPRLRDELARSGRERAQQFSWEECARATYAVYQRVYSESRGAYG